MPITQFAFQLGSGLGGGNKRCRAGRVRTVLTEKQLSMMKSCYEANPRPDALMKEQLVEMTGLSSRVIRVWFQNKRCKDKKRAILKQTKVRKGIKSNNNGSKQIRGSIVKSLVFGYKQLS